MFISSIYIQKTKKFIKIEVLFFTFEKGTMD